MGQGIRRPGASPESERIALGELIHQHVRLAIERPSTRSCAPRWARGRMSAAKDGAGTATARRRAR